MQTAEDWFSHGHDGTIRRVFRNLVPGLVAAAALILAVRHPVAAQQAGRSDSATNATQRRTAEQVHVQVVNDATPDLEAEIYVVPEGQTRHIVADAKPSGKTTISFTPTWTDQNQLQLVAVMNGKRIESKPFTVNGSESLRWDLKSNSLKQAEPGG